MLRSPRLPVPRCPSFLLSLLAVLSIGIIPTSASDWSQWRGPQRNNIAVPGQRVPTRFSDQEQVVWKVNVPGRGHSSPIVVGDLVVLTSADERSQTQAVIGFDRRNGARRWLTPVSTGGFPETHRKNTHASSTVASDGSLFFAAFNHHQKVEAVAVDGQGTIVWRQDVGRFVPQQYRYGYAASPTVYGSTVIISGDCDTGAWMKALDTSTGRIVWEQQRPAKLNWSSPIVGTVAGRDQLLLSGSEMLASYDPATGQPLWSVPCLTMATCGTVVWEDDVVFASGGYPKAETVAVKADGSGTILWSNNVKCYEQSMLVHDGCLYAFSDNGIVFCWDAKTGREHWKHRLRGPVSASPVLVNDLIYAANENGTFYVFRASPRGFEAVAQNQLGRESFATPTVVDNQLFIRVADVTGSQRQEFLYCFGSN